MLRSRRLRPALAPLLAFALAFLPSRPVSSADRVLAEDTYGAKPFLLAFGHYSDEDVDFMAQHYSLVVMGPAYTADLHQLERLQAADSRPRILDYAGPNIMRPYFPDWQFANQHESMFVHSTNPASPVATWLGNGVLLTWDHDGRDGVAVAGYNVYRGRSPGSRAQLLTSSPATETRLTDTSAASGGTYWYSIETVDTSGQTYGFSQPFSVDTSQPPPPLALTSAQANPAPNGQSIAFQATCTGAGAQVWLHADVNRDHSFADPDEAFPMAASGSDPTSFAATLSAPRLGGIPHYYECTNGSHSARLPVDGTYVTNPNNRLHNPRPDSDYWVMSSVDPGWRDHFVAATMNEADRFGYDGLLADTVTASVPWWGTDAMPQGAPYYSDDAWLAGTASILRDLKARLGARLLFHNGPTTNPPTFSQITDGVLNEDWAHSNWEDPYPSAQKWRAEIDDLLSISDSYGRSSLLVSGSAGSEPAQARMFSYASFLIGNRGKSLYGFMNDYLHLNFYPETALEVGTPQPTEAQVSAGVYRRDYSNAVALVNVGEETRSVTLPGSYYQAVPAGGSTQDGGRLTFRATSRVSLPPHSGAVLLKAAPAAPG